MKLKIMPPYILVDMVDTWTCGWVWH